MTTSFWKIWITAKSEEKALRVFEGALAHMNCCARNIIIEPYAKINGFVIRFEIELESEDWNDRVVEVAAKGQRIAVGWILCGDIEQDGSGWSNEIKLPGAVSMEWWLGIRIPN